MLIKQLSSTPEKKLSKINRYLGESFGFTLNSNVKVSVLERMKEKLEDELYQHKINNKTPSDSDYSKTLLMKEGIEMLIASNKKTLKESTVDDVREKVVSWLSEYASKCVNVGDSVDEAVGDAMRHYRSSKYRFPDQEIEQRVREKLHAEVGYDPEPRTLYDDVDTQVSVSEISNSIYAEIETMYPELVDQVGADALGDIITDVALMHTGELTSDDVSRLANTVVDRATTLHLDGEDVFESLKDQFKTWAKNK